MPDPSIIAKIKTQTQIETKITALEAAYESAAENKEYSLDTTQSRQKVEKQDLNKLSKELNDWYTALNIKAGNDHATIYAGKFERGY